MVAIFRSGTEDFDTNRSVELIGFNVVAQISLHGKGFPYKSILRLAVEFPVILPEPPPQRLHGIFQIGLGLVFHQNVVATAVKNSGAGNPRPLSGHARHRTDRQAVQAEGGLPPADPDTHAPGIYQRTG